MQLVEFFHAKNFSSTHLQFGERAAFRPCLIFLSSLFLFLFTTSTAYAQTFTLRDIGSTGATGSYSTGSGPPPTYTIGGAGTGISASGSVDSFAFSNLSTSGNIELQGKVTTLGSTNANSLGGLMMRESYSATAAEVAIYVTSGNGVKFTSRLHGQNSTTVNGSSSTTPVYLRLTKSGNVYTGWESQDGVSWTQVGTITDSLLLPQLYLAGFVSSSTQSGTLNSVTFSNFSYMTSVPQLETDLLAWYRSDAGIAQSSGVTTWSDQSGNGNDASQSTTSQKPTLVQGAVHNSILPAIQFDGTDDRLTMNSGFSNLTSGLDIFVVFKPTSSSGNRTSITVGNASNADSVTVQTNNTDTTLVAYNNTTSSSVSTSNNPIAVGSYQVLEQWFQPGSSNGTGTILVNSVQKAQATNLVSTLRNVSRANNAIGMSNAASDFFQGEIAEIIFYKTKLSDTKRASIQSYLLSKYGLGPTPTLDAPVMTPSSAIMVPYQTVTMSQSQGATIYYSLDGSTPNTTDYPWYNGETLTFPASATLNAIAVAPYFNNSSATATYVVDPNTIGIPRSGLITWLMANEGITLASGNVSIWVSVRAVECLSASTHDVVHQSDGANGHEKGKKAITSESLEEGYR